jgi:leucyl aminopeptidase
MKFDITSTEKITHSSDIIILAIDDKNNIINGNGINEVDESLVKKSLRKDVLGNSEGDTNILNDSTGSRQYLLVRVSDLQSVNIKRLGKIFNKTFAHLSKLTFKTVQMCLCKFARNVKTGITQDGWIEIIDGLEANKDIIVDGAGYLTNDVKIIIKDNDPA